METRKKLPSWWQPIDKALHTAFADEHSQAYRLINDFIVLLTFVSIGSIIAASVDSIYEKYELLFKISEYIVVFFFTLEYIANIYVAKSKRAYVLGPWGIIDFLAIAPSYLNIIDLRAIKLLRVLRILRFLRMMRMLRLLKLAKKATSEFNSSKDQKLSTLKMDLQIYFIALFSVVVIFSTLIFYAERNVADTAFTSIPQSMWWGMVTITTVGYGDMYPATVMGKIIASITMLCGLALFGLLMNVIGKSMMSSLFGSTSLEEINVEEVESQVKKPKD